MWIPIFENFEKTPLSHKYPFPISALSANLVLTLKLTFSLYTKIVGEI